MGRWRTGTYVADSARIRAARILSKMQERDGRWITLASDVHGLLERDYKQIVALGGDNVLLAIMVDICRRGIRSDEFILLRLLKAFTQVDARRSLPGLSLQHDFCTQAVHCGTIWPKKRGTKGQTANLSE